MGPSVIVTESGVNLRQKLCVYIQKIISDALLERDFATLGVSGGSMVNVLTDVLSDISSIEWNRVRFLMCDERLLPFTDPESTFGLYKNQLLPKTTASGLVESCFLPIDPTLDVQACAADYERKLRGLSPPVDGDWPIFDLLLLGLGPDGHTCSLFPGHPVLKETGKWVAAISDSPKPPPERVTLTLPVVNRARHVAFLATGASKQPVLKDVLELNPNQYPAGLVQPKSANLCWFVDRAAVDGINFKAP